MEQSYNPGALEPEVQQRWADNKAFEVTEDSSQDKFYCLSMLPYPSGKLHMGHVRNYTIGDVIARYQRMQGKNVLQPMGWDAFGLPAENAAIKNKVPAAAWTYDNIDHMRGQLQRLGYAIDWSREVTTCKPEYYRWEQLMFTKLFEKGLVYRKSSTVNWDPVENTVLANEQVVDGRGWRSGALVERRELPQWFIKITDYADELLEELNNLEDWPHAVKTMQTNWIGRSEGAQFSMAVCDAAGDSTKHRFEVFTTRPDTAFGMTYCVLAPEHPLVSAITTADQCSAVETFVTEVANTSEVERMAEGDNKRGVFTGAYAFNPFIAKPVPIYIADYVLMTYGTGAIMAVPGQDERDWAFAKTHNLPIVRTVQPPEDFDGGAYTGDGAAINSDWLDGLAVDEAKAKAIDWLVDQGIGERTVNFRLRDWGVSRQRYWGCPIPMILCASCGDVPVPEDQLPVVLPEDVEFMGVQSPIKADPAWRKTQCPRCGGAAERETDTFDTFVESSWYYARYACPGAEAMVDERADYWLPVDQYIGGIEHAVMHLLYFRFWHKLMRDFGWVNSDEPATRLMCQGMVVAETFYRADSDGGKQWLAPDDVALEHDEKGKVVSATLAADGQPVAIGRIEKMSKSKNNGVDPQAMIDAYGADTARLFSVSNVPPVQSLEWSEAGVEGASRFLKRVWRLVAEHIGRPEKIAELDTYALDSEQRALRRKTHETLAKVGDDIERRYTFNTALAAIMELVNDIARFKDRSEQGRAVLQEALESVVLMLNPITPHICDALWRGLGYGDILEQRWPTVDESALVRDEVEIVVQVNGKLRGKITAAPDAPKDEVETAALAESNAARFIEGKEVKKVIVVPNKLVNIVVAG